MDPQNSLEIKGNLLFHPLAEVLAEISQARLSGSIRVSHQTNKTIIYVTEGEVVFAVSNQRKHRVFEMLLEANAVTKKQLVEIPEFTNDFALAKALAERAILPESAMKPIFQRQVENILRDAIIWPEGLWIFTPLARVKEEMYQKVDTGNIVLDYVRCLSPEKIFKRFKTFNESFGRRPTPPGNVSLLPQEAFLLSRFEGMPMRLDEIRSLTGQNDQEMLQRLYCMWLVGFLYRTDWDAAFKDKEIAAFSKARYEVKKQVVAPVVKTPAPEKVETPETDQPEQSGELTLESYLEMIESAETHYETLDISHKATTAEIKQAYFNLAKRFHPDLFHKQTDAKTLKRIQDAFTELAQAYETLRSDELRQTYDFKLRKLLAELEKLSPEERANPSAEQKTLSDASEIFEHGFSLLMEEDYEQAMPYLARAVQMAPGTARYHAYYGKVLSQDKNQRFKAEAELQAAIKLESDNPAHRIMLAEFFIQYNLLKRAEGELNRLLAILPDNKEAKMLLDSLPNK